jgi:hypothetical protein
MPNIPISGLKYLLPHSPLLQAQQMPADLQLEIHKYELHMHVTTCLQQQAAKKLYPSRIVSRILQHHGPYKVVRPTAVSFQNLHDPAAGLQF